MSTQKPETQKEIICSTCHIKFNSVIHYKLHLTTEFHVYNTKRRIAELPPITEDIFEQKKAQMVSANQSALSEMVHKCQACNKLFKSQEKKDEHKASKKHKKNQKEFQATHPEVDEDSIF
jgi:pre-60S factor REI1